MGAVVKLSCADVRELAAGYVLDALEPAEASAVGEHLQTCSEAHEEFHELGGVAPYLAETIEPVEPPASLKARVLAAAAADLGEPRAGLRPVAPATPRRIAPAEPRRFPLPMPAIGRAAEQRYRPSPLAWVAGIAAAVLIFVLGGTAFVLQGELQAARQYQRGVAAVLDLAAGEGSQVAILSGAGNGPAGIAAIGVDGQVAMAVRDLPATVGNEVYEAWVIVGEQAPVAIGGFRVDESGTATLVTAASPPPPGAVLALTREPGPGATAPTGPIVASGTASAPPS